jgi:peptidoglycan LD-endopeptidase LytH
MAPSRFKPCMRFSFLAFAILIVAGFAVPERAMIPVTGASAQDWNAQSFWFAPWGKSGVHKGIDIFAPAGQRVVSSTPGMVLYQGDIGMGGNVVVVLGPKWRVHYYAHLASATSVPRFVAQGDAIGLVGTSGNAAGKPPHLHYSIVSLMPLPWHCTRAPQGWKRMFYLDPGTHISPKFSE